jgi:hypothetical protein
MSSSPSSAGVVSILVPAELQGAVQAFVAAYQHAARDIADPSRLQEAEQRLHGASDVLFASAMQPVVQRAVAAGEATKRRAHRLTPTWLQRLLGLPHGFKNQGPRTVHIRLSAGPAIAVRVTYHSRPCDRNRPAARKGCYPALECLGVFDRCTPLLASHAALCVALCGSLAEAEEMLRLQGASVDGKTLTNVVYRFAARARANLRRARYRLPGQASAKGLRLVVALDGGRTRLRQNKPGRRRPSGRHGYRTPWREPKLLYIYAIDEAGKKVDTFKPIVDGTFERLADSEEIFARVKGYLSALHVEEAHEVVFIGDGAPWVTNRVPQLLQELKLAAEGVRVVVDFYHAVEHVKAVADLQRQWGEAEKKRWRREQRGRLYRGAVGQVIEAIEGLRGKRKGKQLETEREYFVSRVQEMRYAAFRKAGLPIGSGAVESAMRRIVNLRLKGAGIFWLKENAEHVLLLRCYAKAGRWANLLPLALCSTLLPTP